MLLVSVVIRAADFIPHTFRLLLVSVAIRAADFIPRMYIRACIIHIADFGIPYLTKAGKGMNLICVYIKRNATETVSQSIN